MKLLLDMNLSPRWVGFLRDHGTEATHWSEVGNHGASDASIMDYARDKGFVVFTHDLDFSHILAMTQAAGPSVLQVRTQDVSPGAIGAKVIEVLTVHRDALERGAVVTIDEANARVRILPIGHAP